MQFSIRNVGIIASLVISGAMVATAFILSGPATSRVSAESAQELLEAYAAQDTDNDGLADWQEAVYGTDPGNRESAKPGMTDAEAVRQGLVAPKFVADESTDAAVTIPTEEGPEDTTLTAKFSRDFFADYLSGRSAEPPTSEQIQVFVADAVDELSATAGTRFSSKDLSVSGSGEVALREYAANAEAAFNTLGINTDSSMIVLLADAIHKNDTAALGLVRRLAKVYETGAATFVHVPVPAETATGHLRMANALAHLGAVGQDMASIKEDPLRGFVGITAYQNAARELRDAVKDIGATFGDVTIPSDEKGAMFYYLTQAAIAE